MGTSAIQSLSTWFWHFAAAKHCPLSAFQGRAMLGWFTGSPPVFVVLSSMMLSKQFQLTGIRVTAKRLGIPPSNKTGNAIKSALAPFDKLLLTARPLQNSLLELFGLVSIIDEHIFGDMKSFRVQFARLESDGKSRGFTRAPETDLPAHASASAASLERRLESQMRRIAMFAFISVVLR